MEPRVPGRGAPIRVALFLAAVALAPLAASCTAVPSRDAAAPAVDAPAAAAANPLGDEPAGRAAPPRIAVVGDSTAERLAPAVAAWASATGEVTYAGNASRLACPIGRGGTMHTAADAIGPVNDGCDWETTATEGLDGSERPTFAALVADWDPDLVLVSNGLWDVADRQLPGDTTWRHLGDPVYDEWLLGELVAATDELSTGGAHVVWLTLSRWEGATRHPPDRFYAPAADPTRVLAYNELIDRVVAARPDTASVVDLAGWLDETGEDARLRPDGAHFEPDTAVEVVDRFLSAALLAQWRAIAGP